MTNKRMMKLMVYNQFPVIFIELPGKKKKLTFRVEKTQTDLSTVG